MGQNRRGSDKEPATRISSFVQASLAQCFWVGFGIGICQSWKGLKARGLAIIVKVDLGWGLCRLKDDRTRPSPLERVES